jgi:hypothetical protein
MIFLGVFSNLYSIAVVLGIKSLAKDYSVKNLKLDIFKRSNCVVQNIESLYRV